MKVYKYIVNMQKDLFTIPLPVGTRILSFQCQRDVLCLWALVNPQAYTEERQFRIAGTGHSIDIPSEKLHFIGTAQMLNGDLIWHLFEII